MSRPPRGEIWATARAAWDGRLPQRYETDLWDRRFRARIDELLAPGQRILDVGSGSRPVLSPSERPAGSMYVGLDVSESALAHAPAASYDETVVTDITCWHPMLSERFDLVISWMVLEHVKPLDTALDNIRGYLRPGGLLVAQLAGRFSPFSLAGALTPERFANWLLPKIQDRPPGTIFPAHYDRCSYDGLTHMLRSGWSDVSITPIYTAAGYVEFSRMLTAVYLGYEEWTYRSSRANLAPYYLISGTSSVSR